MTSKIFFFKILKALKKAFLIFLGLLLVYFLLAFLLSFCSTKPEQILCESETRVYLLTNGIHLDIVLHRDQVEKIYRDQIKDAENFEYLAFGWGDKGFYLETPTWAELKLSTAFKAVLWKSPSAMHVTKYPVRRKDFVEINLCKKQLQQLKAFIFETFEKDAEGLFKEIPDSGYTPRDHFYEAKGSYNAILTCNQWVNNALKAAQVKTAIWSPTDHGVLYHRK